jgi:lipopolysaccharide export system protein LptA
MNARRPFRLSRFGLATAPLAALGLALAPISPLAAQQRSGPVNAPLTNLGQNSRDPIKIDADRLEVMDRDSKAVFSGNVVAVQGRTTIRCSKLTIVYENRGGAAGTAGRQAPAPASVGADGGIRRLDCDGPVTVTSDDQVATGQRATFDRERDLVIMSGDVALAKGPNVTRGERLTYNTRTGIANIEGGRVRGFFVPGSGDQPASAPPRR